MPARPSPRTAERVLNLIADAGDSGRTVEELALLLNLRRAAVDEVVLDLLRAERIYEALGELRLTDAETRARVALDAPGVTPALSTRSLIDIMRARGARSPRIERVFDTTPEDE